MITGEQVHSPARQAALLLHALAPQDCAWLLAELEPAQRASAQRLLAELRELGIPSDHALLQPVVDTAPAPQAATARLAALSDPELDALASALAKEPPALVAALVQAPAFAGCRRLFERLSLPPPAAEMTSARPAFDAALENVTLRWLESVMPQQTSARRAPLRPWLPWRRA